MGGGRVWKERGFLERKADRGYIYWGKESENPGMRDDGAGWGFVGMVSAR